MKVGEVYLHKEVNAEYVQTEYDYAIEIKHIRSATDGASVKVLDLISGNIRDDVISSTRIDTCYGYYKVDIQKLFEVMKCARLENKALKDMLEDRNTIIDNFDTKKNKSSVVVCLKNGGTVTVEGGTHWEMVAGNIFVKDDHNTKFGEFKCENVLGIFLKRLDKLSRQ